MYKEELLIIDLQEIMWKLIQTIKTYRSAANCPSWQYSRRFIERSKMYCLFALALEQKVRVLENNSDHFFEEKDNTRMNCLGTMSTDDFISLFRNCKQTEYELLDKYNILFYKSYVGGALRDLITEQRERLKANIEKWQHYEHELAQIAC